MFLLSLKACLSTEQTDLFNRVQWGTEINTKCAYMSTRISHQGLFPPVIQQIQSTAWPYGHSQES